MKLIRIKILGSNISWAYYVIHLHAQTQKCYKSSLFPYYLSMHKTL